MGKVAFVFSGQGDQYPGMGKELYERYPVAREVFDQCERIRPGTTLQCLQGTAEELRETRNTQPCLFAMELAAARVLTQAGARPEMAAGFSLGEVTAATFSGVFDDAEGFRMVCKRGELMHRAALQSDTSMAAVLRLTPDQVRAICARHAEVYPVNYNCPGQVSVAGLSAQMPDYVADVKEAGGRAVPLQVAGAFHSPFMQHAADAFAAELAEAEIHTPAMPLYSDLTAAPYEGNAADLLARQICNPVQWERLVRNMIAAGADTLVEIGPGRTLTNMTRKIDSSVRAMTYTEYLEEAGRC